MAHDAAEPASRSRPAIAGPGLWVRGLIPTIAVLLLMFSTLSAVAQPERFNDVKSWRGTFIAWAHQDTADAIVAKDGQSRGTRTIYYDSSIVVDFLLDEFEDEPAVWRGRLLNPNLVADYRGVSNMVINAENGSTLFEEEFFSTSGPPQFAPGAKAELLFHRERGWSFHFPTPRRPTELTYKSTLKPTNAPERHREEQGQTLTMTESGTATLPYPAKGMILFAGDKKSNRKLGVPGRLAGDQTWEYTVYLEPASMEELRLEIDEPAEYATWRPETTPERDPGKPMEVTARLVSSTGGKPNTKVESFEWVLQNTSKEPGVALNFPLDQFTDDPDLELDASGEFFVLSQENQKMERAVRDGYTDKVKVVPFDWGGWSTLQVTAVLADGRRVMGKLKGKSERGLRVPKRDPNSHIADGWKAKHKTGADELDDEDEPVGDGNKGDGYTLYEEYRGFVIEGEHVEGDPKAKDFFVLNLIGEDAELGLGLFESLSGFHVHTTKLNTEISEQHRIMNGNRTEGANVVVQHGVEIILASSASELAGEKVDSYGALTKATDVKYKPFSFRPGITDRIAILPRGHAESDFSKPFNLGAADAAGAFDRAIAHELMHSVGALEHGVGDGRVKFTFVPPKNRMNTAGRPYFALSGDEQKPVDLRDEGKRDIAAATYVRYATALAALMRFYRSPLMGNPGDPGYPRMSEADLEVYCDSYLSDSYSLAGLVGAENGPHSGNQDCIMRYYFANFYRMKPPGDGFYQIEPGAERIGFSLCRSPEGTGVNSTGHYPQSRHGNAANGAGNCAAQISPNDLVPPRPEPF